MFGPIITSGDYNEYTTHAVYGLIKHVKNDTFNPNCIWPQIDRFFIDKEDRNDFVENSTMYDILDFFDDKRVDTELLRAVFEDRDWRQVWKFDNCKNFIDNVSIEKAFEIVADFD